MRKNQDLKSNHSKKVAILIPQFYWGGMPQVASNLIHLLEGRYSITLILVNSNLEIRKDTYSADIIRLSGSPIKKLIKLKKIMKVEKFKAIISFGIIDNILNILLAPRKTNTIVTEHSTKSFDNSIEPNKIKRILYAICLRVLYPKANKIVAVSNGIKEDLEETYGIKNVLTIYNPLLLNQQMAPLSDKDAALIEDIKEMGGKIAINVGRITRPKGQWNLVNSFKYLKDTNLHLVLVGEGPDEKLIKELIRDNGLESKVHLIGSRKNIVTWMKMCDVYLSLSWFEGFPTALLEAISSGIPVISADIFSGPREILSNGQLLNYTTDIEYPQYLENGILTKRFDFRDNNFDEDEIENNFARVVAAADLDSKNNYSLTLDFLDNKIIVKLYEKIIEDK